ncbi:MAG: hypothetical protein ROY82_08720 [Truepera sp.]|jgi:uncharacterized C2H2 Zn-finger protein|nr:hypothetical protein [Truepera sp.]
MSNPEKLVPLPTDSDGYIRFQCPSCTANFKLSSNELYALEEKVFFCVACGHRGTPVNFMTPDTTQYLNEALRNMAREAIERSVKSLRPASGTGFTLKPNRNFKLQREPELEPIADEELDLHEFACCGRSAKVNTLDESLGLYCPYCGEQA